MNRYVMGLIALGVALWATAGDRLNQLGDQLTNWGRSTTTVDSTVGDGTVVSSAPQATAPQSVQSLDTLESYGTLVQRQSQAGSGSVPTASTSVFDQSSGIPSQVPGGQGTFIAPTTTGTAGSATGTSQATPAGGDISPVTAPGVPPTRTTVSTDNNLDSIPALW